MKLLVMILGSVTIWATSLGCGGQESLSQQQNESAREAASKMGHAGFRTVTARRKDGQFASRITMNFRDQPVTDKKLKHVEGLDGIIGIDLSNTEVTDTGMKILATLPDLEYLQLGDTKITDAGLRELKLCPKLNRLDIRRTKVTEKASKILAEFPSLKMIYTKGTGIRSVKNKEVNSKDELDAYWDN